MQAFCIGLNECAALVSGVIQEKRDGDIQVERCQFPQELAHAFRVDIGRVGDRDQFVCDGIECAMLSWRKESYKDKEKKYFVSILVF